jgi:hypothetical protein
MKLPVFGLMTCRSGTPLLEERFRLKPVLSLRAGPEPNSLSIQTPRRELEGNVGGFLDMYENTYRLK